MPLTRITHRSLPRTSTALVAAALVSAAFPACGGREGGFDSTESRTFTVDDAGPDAPSCQGLRCSRDLKKVLGGCDDAIVEECSEGRGCGEGRCIDACTAAAISKGSVGCAFAMLPPDETGIHNMEGSSYGSCFAAIVANTWDRPVSMSAELGGEPLDISHSVYLAEGSGDATKYRLLEGPLLPEQVALVFLSQSPHPGRKDSHISCPLGVTAAFGEDPIRHGSGTTRAFRLTTDAPVSAYSIYPYGGAGSFYPTATLLLPVSSWDTNYIAMTPLGGGTGGQVARQVMQIVAAEDATDVAVRMPNSGSVVEHWTLNKDQVAQVTEANMLAGSLIETNKPVALFGGNECTGMFGGACDVLQQQIPALSQWGSDYALVPYRPRIIAPDADDTTARENVPWRLVGGADGTVLTYEPERPLNAPATLQAGEVATFQTTQLLRVKSQDDVHPFFAAVMMTGAAANEPTTLGDPDFVTVVPSAQFLDRYVFFVDFTFPETTLSVVRRKTAKGFAPVTLDCGGEITSFRPLGTSGEYEYAWVVLTSGYASKRVPGTACGYGRNEASSDGPFSVTVWGIGPFASYGYTGGTGSRPLHPVRAPITK